MLYPKIKPEQAAFTQQDRGVYSKEIVKMKNNYSVYSTVGLG
jgi:hypothetical protein